MSVLRIAVRPGVYQDSVVLLQLQAGLAGLPGIEDAGVVMGTAANLALLDASGLWDGETPPTKNDDLVVAVRAVSSEAAAAALDQVDERLRRKAQAEISDYRPRSLTAAFQQRPSTRWVLVSVPGRYAAGVAREALAHGRHVFLFSDNVPLEDELSLKQEARRRGLLVMGPDCGTAIVNGVGLGFANRVRRGAIGLIGASGTGLQAVSSHIHQEGAGISQALGTGGRDLSATVGGITALQSLALLRDDPETRAIVLISKPPAPEVASRLLAAALHTGKPVVACLLGYSTPLRRVGNLYFAAGLQEAAELALSLQEIDTEPFSTQPGFLRGLFSGGTLSYEALLALRSFYFPMVSNVTLAGIDSPADPSRSQGHAILDLGADEYTIGRPHPMIDLDLLRRRFRQEAADPEVGTILFDLVLGDGAHPDPAGELVPLLKETRELRPELALVAVVVGTDEDPQSRSNQIARLEEAGALVFTDVVAAAAHVARSAPPPALRASLPIVPLTRDGTVVAINVGLERFADSLRAQGAEALHLDWRPPAGGDERLQAILARMKSRPGEKP